MGARSMDRDSPTRDVTMGIGELFQSRFDKSPDGLWQSPGRVNLIGEHTDYNEGFVLPFAIDRRLRVAVARRADRRIVVDSIQLGRGVELRLDAQDKGAGWALYVMGVLRSFEDAGVDVPGLEILIDSDIPLGAGLSSSAALEAAIAVAVNDIVGAGRTTDQLVALCHRAESHYVGVPVGVMDQNAVLATHADHAILIDCRSHDVRQVRLALGPMLIIDTRVRHDNADGAYAERRRACERVATSLGVTSLRDATPSMVEGLHGEAQRLVRHVVGENARVLETVRRLEGGLPIGDLLLSSHASLRDDFRVSCPELDCAVDVAVAAGAQGARLTGAGFGGCVIVVGGDHELILKRAVNEFRRRGFAPPEGFRVSPSQGAGAFAD